MEYVAQLLIGNVNSYLKDEDGMQYNILCRFLGKLLDRGLTTFHIPRSYDYMNSSNKESIEKLMNQVSSRCQPLRQLKAEIKFSPRYDDDLIDDDIQWFKPILFRALPQLANLQIVQLENLGCNDQILEEFAMHLKNLE